MRNDDPYEPYDPDFDDIEADPLYHMWRRDDIEYVKNCLTSTMIGVLLLGLLVAMILGLLLIEWK